jgi:hypothetical protein
MSKNSISLNITFQVARKFERLGVCLFYFANYEQFSSAPISHSLPPSRRAIAVRLSFYGQAIPPSTNAPTVAYIRYLCFECLSPDGLRRCMTRESECCVHDVRFAVLLFNGHMISGAIDMPENICIHFIMFDARNDPVP